MALRGYAIAPREGEHLVLRGGDIFIKADRLMGSKGLAMGTQQIPVGIGIPIHRHLEMDEAFYVIVISASMPASRSRSGAEKVGSTPLIASSRVRSPPIFRFKRRPNLNY